MIFLSFIWYSLEKLGFISIVLLLLWLMLLSRFIVMKDNVFVMLKLHRDVVRLEATKAAKDIEIVRVKHTISLLQEGSIDVLQEVMIRTQNRAPAGSIVLKE